MVSVAHRLDHCNAHTLSSLFLPLQLEPGDYSYSGMHDDGPLPAPKEGGLWNQMISNVQAAKRFSDEYMTNIINQEKATKEASHPPKKPKTNEEQS